MLRAITYSIIQTHIDSGYCTKLVEKLKTPCDNSEKHMILLELVQFAMFEQRRQSLCQVGICNILHL